MLPLSDEQKPFGFLTTPFSESQAQLSPTGVGWRIDRTSREDSRSTFRAFRSPPASGRYPPAAAGQPRWRGDGKELYYLSSINRLMAVPINAGAGLRSDPLAAI